MSEKSENNVPEIELEISKLPSRGVPYPSKGTVKYRTYTWGEVRRASTSRSSTAERLREVMKGIDCSFDKTKLTVADALYLGILRKISTFSGLQIEVPYVCRHCGKSNKGLFTHNDINFRDLPLEVTEFPLVAEIEGRELEFAPMTVREYLELHDGRHAKVLKGSKIDEVAVQATWVKNLDYAEAYSVINGLTSPEAFEDITEIDKMIRHDMEPLTFECQNSKCKAKNLVRLEGRDALLRPFRDGEKPKRSRIRIGKRVEPTNNDS
jgi:hypothetical protein